jgi:hypothetical protein
MKKEEREQMIKDMQHCIKQFKKARMFTLAKLKQRKLDELMKK